MRTSKCPRYCPADFCSFYQMNASNDVYPSHTHSINFFYTGMESLNNIEFLQFHFQFQFQSKQGEDLRPNSPWSLPMRALGHFYPILIQTKSEGYVLISVQLIKCMPPINDVTDPYPWNRPKVFHRTDDRQHALGTEIHSERFRHAWIDQEKLLWRCQHPWGSLRMHKVQGRSSPAVIEWPEWNKLNWPKKVPSSSTLH